MNYLKYVNVMQGTDSVPSYSNGNTLPLAVLPFGAVSFSPETRRETNFFFNPNDHTTTGVRLTHQPSPWIGDYGNITLMPASGEDINYERYQSGFRYDRCEFSPIFHKMEFLRYRTSIEIAPGMHNASIRLNFFEQTKTCRLIISGFNLKRKTVSFEQIGENRLLVITNAYTDGASETFKTYFSLEFSEPIDRKNSLSFDESGISIAFFGNASEINVKLGQSFISRENSERHMAEVDSLEGMRERAQKEWNDLLGKIEIEADNEKLKTFYSCLYRMFIFPRTFFEQDQNGMPYHIDLYKGVAQEGVMFTDNGFWDTCKTVYYLYSIIIPEKYKLMCEGFLNFYRDFGWLPKWLSPGERYCMPGTMIDAIFADAAQKGIVTDKSLLCEMLDGMIKHSLKSEKTLKNEQWINGRSGVELFNKYGFVPSSEKESVNKTLDYAYGNFCIYRLASILGKEEIAASYKKSALNYRNLFDKETGFMRAKDIAGNFRPDWNEFDWGGEYTEGSAYQNSFAVFYDFKGLERLYGSKENFEAKLDELFSKPSYFNIGGYSCEIHEMTEMASVNFGQCALSNQPSFHIPYIYSALGIKHKTEYWVRKAMSELFSPSSAGFPGDEDNGSMAGWYVFSSLGFYPMCHGVGEYVLGSPNVRSAIIHLPDGKEFVIKANNNTNENVYVSSALLNGKDYSKTFLKHSDIIAGGKFVFEMTDKAKKNSPDCGNLPYSLANNY